MSNFLTPITAPALNSPTFARDIQEVFENINANFVKIASAPYLEGQEGKSVTTTDVDIISDGELTDFGVKMCRVIFDNDTINTIADIDTLIPSYGTQKVSDYLFEHPTMKVLCTYSPDTNELDEYLCGAEYYYFIDLRVKDISDNVAVHQYAGDFTDYTCIIFAQCDDEVWSFSKATMMPTLYFNDDINCFCWKVNDQKTNIRAQGLKGDKGDRAYTAVVFGNGVETSSTSGEKALRVFVTKYAKRNITTDDEFNVTVDDQWDDIENSGLKDGDLVCCIFNIKDETYGTDYPDMIIGNISIIGDTSTSRIYTLTQPSSTRFSYLWQSYLIFYAMKQIDYKTTNLHSTKAMFVPAYNEGIVHAIFQDDSGVDYSENDDEVSVIDRNHEDNITIKKVYEDRITGSGSIGNENRMTASDERPHVSDQTKMNIIGYDVHVDGSASGTVNKIKNTELGVPVGCVMNWIDMNNIPEGWYRTGEVSNKDLHVPVFKLNEVDGTSYDLEVVGSRGFRLKYQFVYPNTNEHNIEFSKIFCALSSYTHTSPIIIETEYSRFEDFYNTDGFGWNNTGFDIMRDGQSKDVLFYLTKNIEQ